MKNFLQRLRAAPVKKSYDHAESVNVLFDKILAVVSASPLDREWLAIQKRNALCKNRGWKTTLEGYLHGLLGAGKVSREIFTELRDSLGVCIDSEASWSEFLLPLAWTACVAAVTVSGRAISMDWWFVATIVVMTAFAGAMWAAQRSWLKPSTNPKNRNWERPFVIVACAALVPVLTFLITFVVGTLIQKYSIQRFEEDRIEFASDPQGFPMLHKFARTNFNIEVVLGNANDSWATTTVNLPRSSIASMSLSPGYCVLNMYRDNVLRSFEPARKQSETLWIQGVMMHEFGHCLDGLRDLPRFGEDTVQVHSIAPIDAKGVTNMQSYLSATEEDSTMLWREALADTFAVGFWRLASPSEADSLAASLRRKRSDDAGKGDPTHGTMCWIDQATQAAPPSSEKDLLAWADYQRSVAQCVIQKPGKKISALKKFREFMGRLTKD